MPIIAEPIADREPWRIPMWLGLCAFLAIAGLFLWEEHRAYRTVERRRRGWTDIE
jgi:hypothetical protein